MMQLLILITTEEEYKFFSRFTKSLSLLGWEIYFSTQIPSIKLRIKLNNFKNSKIHLIPIDIPEQELFKYFHRVLSKFNFDLVFLWNGNGKISKELNSACKSISQKTLYFELANIPRKLFVDNLGVNKTSNLYIDPNYLNRFVVSDNEYQIWLNNYFVEKKAQTRLPQVSFTKNINFWFIYDYLFYFFSSTKPFGEYRLSRKIFYFINLFNGKKIKYDKILPNDKYIFLPLQVSNDTQIKFNSNINNLEAIKISKDLAENENLELIVKLHPAETDINFINHLVELKSSLDFKITNKNTFELVKNSKKVITINSTVGLESKILNKEVIFLGESFYKNLHYQNIKKYILKFLIDIDPFGNEEISIEHCKEVIKRS